MIGVVDGGSQLKHYNQSLMMGWVYWNNSDLFGQLKFCTVHTTFSWHACVNKKRWWHRYIVVVDSKYGSDHHQKAMQHDLQWQTDNLVFVHFIIAIIIQVLNTTYHQLIDMQEKLAAYAGRCRHIFARNLKRLCVSMHGRLLASYYHSNVRFNMIILW